jgi:hypothetical protein
MGADKEDDSEWDWAKLLPSSLFSADPGLLTVDFASLSEEVCQVLKETATVAHVCALSAAELWMPGVMDSLIRVWRVALTQVCLSWGTELPVSRFSFPSCVVHRLLIALFALVVSSLNSSNHGTASSRLPSEAYMAQLTTTTTKMAKRMTWCRNSPS